MLNNEHKIYNICKIYNIQCTSYPEHKIYYVYTVNILNHIAKRYACDVYVYKNCLEMNMVYTWCNLKSSCWLSAI